MISCAAIQKLERYATLALKRHSLDDFVLSSIKDPKRTTVYALTHEETWKEAKAAILFEVMEKNLIEDPETSEATHGVGEKKREEDEDENVKCGTLSTSPASSGLASSFSLSPSPAAANDVFLGRELRPVKRVVRITEQFIFSIAFAASLVRHHLQETLLEGVLLPCVWDLIQREKEQQEQEEKRVLGSHPTSKKMSWYEWLDVSSTMRKEETYTAKRATSSYKSSSSKPTTTTSNTIKKEPHDELDDTTTLSSPLSLLLQSLPAALLTPEVCRKKKEWQAFPPVFPFPSSSSLSGMDKKERSFRTLDLEAPLRLLRVWVAVLRAMATASDGDTLRMVATSTNPMATSPRAAMDERSSQEGEKNAASVMVSSLAGSLQLHYTPAVTQAVSQLLKVTMDILLIVLMAVLGTSSGAYRTVAWRNGTALIENDEENEEEEDVYGARMMEEAYTSYLLLFDEALWMMGAVSKLYSHAVACHPSQEAKEFQQRHTVSAMLRQVLGQSTAEEKKYEKEREKGPEVSISENTSYRRKPEETTHKKRSPTTLIPVTEEIDGGEKGGTSPLASSVLTIRLQRWLRQYLSSRTSSSGSHTSCISTSGTDVSTRKPKMKTEPQDEENTMTEEGLAPHEDPDVLFQVLQYSCGEEMGRLPSVSTTVTPQTFLSGTSISSTTTTLNVASQEPHHTAISESHPSTAWSSLPWSPSSSLSPWLILLASALDSSTAGGLWDGMTLFQRLSVTYALLSTAGWFFFHAPTRRTVNTTTGMAVLWSPRRMDMRAQCCVALLRRCCLLLQRVACNTPTQLMVYYYGDELAKTAALLSNPTLKEPLSYSLHTYVTTPPIDPAIRDPCASLLACPSSAIPSTCCVSFSVSWKTRHRRRIAFCLLTWLLSVPYFYASFCTHEMGWRTIPQEQRRAVWRRRERQARQAPPPLQDTRYGKQKGEGSPRPRQQQQDDTSVAPRSRRSVLSASVASRASRLSMLSSSASVASYTSFLSLLPPDEDEEMEGEEGYPRGGSVAEDGDGRRGKGEGGDVQQRYGHAVISPDVNSHLPLMLLEECVSGVYQCLAAYPAAALDAYGLRERSWESIAKCFFFIQCTLTSSKAPRQGTTAAHELEEEEAAQEGCWMDRVGENDGIGAGWKAFGEGIETNVVEEEEGIARPGGTQALRGQVGFLNDPVYHHYHTLFAPTASLLSAPIFDLSQDLQYNNGLGYEVLAWLFAKLIAPRIEGEQAKHLSSTTSSEAHPTRGAASLSNGIDRLGRTTMDRRGLTGGAVVEEIKEEHNGDEDLTEEEKQEQQRYREVVAARKAEEARRVWYEEGTSSLTRLPEKSSGVSHVLERHPASPSSTTSLSSPNTTAMIPASTISIRQRHHFDAALSLCLSVYEMVVPQVVDQCLIAIIRLAMKSTLYPTTTASSSSTPTQGDPHASKRGHHEEEEEEGGGGEGLTADGTRAPQDASSIPQRVLYEVFPIHQWMHAIPMRAFSASSPPPLSVQFFCTVMQRIGKSQRLTDLVLSMISMTTLYPFSPSSSSTAAISTNEDEEEEREGSHVPSSRAASTTAPHSHASRSIFPLYLLFQLPLVRQTYLAACAQTMDVEGLLHPFLTILTAICTQRGASSSSSSSRDSSSSRSSSSSSSSEDALRVPLPHPVCVGWLLDLLSLTLRGVPLPSVSSRTILGLLSELELVFTSAFFTTHLRSLLPSSTTAATRRARSAATNDAQEEVSSFVYAWLVEKGLVAVYHTRALTLSCLSDFGDDAFVLHDYIETLEESVWKVTTPAVAAIGGWEEEEEEEEEHTTALHAKHHEGDVGSSVVPLSWLSMEEFLSILQSFSSSSSFSSSTPPPSMLLSLLVLQRLTLARRVMLFLWGSPQEVSSSSSNTPIRNEDPSHSHPSLSFTSFLSSPAYTTAVKSMVQFVLHHLSAATPSRPRPGSTEVDLSVKQQVKDGPFISDVMSLALEAKRRESVALAHHMTDEEWRVLAYWCGVTKHTTRVGMVEPERSSDGGGFHKKLRRMLVSLLESTYTVTTLSSCAGQTSAVLSGWGPHPYLSTTAVVSTAMVVKEEELVLWSWIPRALRCVGGAFLRAVTDYFMEHTLDEEEWDVSLEARNPSTSTRVGVALYVLLQSYATLGQLPYWPALLSRSIHHLGACRRLLNRYGSHSVESGSPRHCSHASRNALGVVSSTTRRATSSSSSSNNSHTAAAVARLSVLKTSLLRLIHYVLWGEPRSADVLRRQLVAQAVRRRSTTALLPEVEEEAKQEEEEEENGEGQVGAQTDVNRKPRALRAPSQKGKKGGNGEIHSQYLCMLRVPAVTEKDVAIKEQGLGNDVASSSSAVNGGAAQASLSFSPSDWCFDEELEELCQLLWLHPKGEQRWWQPRRSVQDASSPSRSSKEKRRENVVGAVDTFDLPSLLLLESNDGTHEDEGEEGAFTTTCTPAAAAASAAASPHHQQLVMEIVCFLYTTAIRASAQMEKFSSRMPPPPTPHSHHTKPKEEPTNPKNLPDATMSPFTMASQWLQHVACTLVGDFFIIPPATAASSSASSSSSVAMPSIWVSRLSAFLTACTRMKMSSSLLLFEGSTAPSSSWASKSIRGTASLVTTHMERKYDEKRVAPEAGGKEVIRMQMPLPVIWKNILYSLCSELLTLPFSSSLDSASSRTIAPSRQHRLLACSRCFNQLYPLLLHHRIHPRGPLSSLGSSSRSTPLSTTTTTTTTTLPACASVSNAMAPGEESGWYDPFFAPPPPLPSSSSSDMESSPTDASLDLWISPIACEHRRQAIVRQFLNTLQVPLSTSSRASRTSGTPSPRFHTLLHTFAPSPTAIPSSTTALSLLPRFGEEEDTSSPTPSLHLTLWLLAFLGELILSYAREEEQKEVVEVVGKKGKSADGHPPSPHAWDSPLRLVVTFFSHGEPTAVSSSFSVLEKKPSMRRRYEGEEEVEMGSSSSLSLPSPISSEREVLDRLTQLGVAHRASQLVYASMVPMTPSFFPARRKGGGGGGEGRNGASEAASKSSSTSSSSSLWRGCMAVEQFTEDTFDALLHWVASHALLSDGSPVAKVASTKRIPIAPAVLATLATLLVALHPRHTSRTPLQRRKGMAFQPLSTPHPGRGEDGEGEAWRTPGRRPTTTGAYNRRLLCLLQCAASPVMWWYDEVTATSPKAVVTTTTPHDALQEENGAVTHAEVRACIRLRQAMLSLLSLPLPSFSVSHRTTRISSDATLVSLSSTRRSRLSLVHEEESEESPVSKTSCVEIPDPPKEDDEDVPPPTTLPHPRGFPLEGGLSRIAPLRYPRTMEGSEWDGVRHDMVEEASWWYVCTMIHQALLASEQEERIAHTSSSSAPRGRVEDGKPLADRSLSASSFSCVIPSETELRNLLSLFSRQWLRTPTRARDGRGEEVPKRGDPHHHHSSSSFSSSFGVRFHRGKRTREEGRHVSQESPSHRRRPRASMLWERAEQLPALLTALLELILQQLGVGRYSVKVLHALGSFFYHLVQDAEHGDTLQKWRANASWKRKTTHQSDHRSNRSSSSSRSSSDTEEAEGEEEDKPDTEKEHGSASITHRRSSPPPKRRHCEGRTGHTLARRSTPARGSRYVDRRQARRRMLAIAALTASMFHVMSHPRYLPLFSRYSEELHGTCFADLLPSLQRWTLPKKWAVPLRWSLSSSLPAGARASSGWNGLPNVASTTRLEEEEGGGEEGNVEGNGDGTMPFRTSLSDLAYICVGTGEGKALLRQTAQQLEEQKSEKVMEYQAGRHLFNVV